MKPSTTVRVVADAVAAVSQENLVRPMAVDTEVQALRRRPQVSKRCARVLVATLSP
jgi:hypothetical protein